MPKRSHDTPKPKQRTPFLIPEFEIIIDDSLDFTIKNFCFSFKRFEWDHSSGEVYFCLHFLTASWLISNSIEHTCID